MAKAPKAPDRPQPGPRAPRVPAPVRDEERWLLKVHKALAGATRRAGPRLPYEDELLKLRDAVAEEKLLDDQAMLIDQMDRLAALAAARARARIDLPDPLSPYFAHLALQTDADERKDILLGKHTFVSGEVRIVDWRNAPVSSLYYRYQQGDPFAETIAGKTWEGQVTLRRAVTIQDGALVRISTPRGGYVRGPAGWAQTSAPGQTLAGGAGTARRPDTTASLRGVSGLRPELRTDKHLPEIAALLDPEQFALLTRDGRSLLVVSGGAGSGKTTVGLHRLAFLAFQEPERFRPNRMLVLVFSQALERYISRVLPALGVSGVQVRTLHAWASFMMRKHFPGLPRDFSDSTPAAVVRFKTHRALVPLLGEATRAAPRADPAALFDELFTDRGWIRSGVERLAPGAFSATEIEAIHRWCTDQQFQRAEGSEQPADDDQDGAAAGYDEEDALILLRLHQQLRGPLLFAPHRKLSYDHLMVDEAQDFSPLELQVLAQTARDHSLTLAGDPAQKITDNDFGDWGDVLEAIGQPRFEVRPLRISYRSTRPIMEIARAVLGPLAPATEAVAPRDGAPVELLRFEGQGEALTFLSDALADLARREPSASVALLTRTPEQAAETFAVLKRADLASLGWVQNQEFSFGPGIEITDVAQTKGLEFDYVIVLYADRENYPDTQAARHLLHVGCTRAIHQLWLVGWGAPSPLLPAGLRPRSDP